jgi:hypothetical protein
MWHLFLDESGDLGFDFVNKKPSHYFTVCILAVSEPDSYYGIRKAVRTTLRRKVNHGKKGLPFHEELHATETTLPVKKYFYDKVKPLKFSIYSLTLNKLQLFEQLTHDKERIYNFLARQTLDRIPLEKATDWVQLTVDKSKGKREIKEFNEYIIQQLKGKLNPSVPLSINHLDSREDAGLQAVDLFAWGILRKYEKKDFEWFNYYEEKVRLDELYLP